MRLKAAPVAGLCRAARESTDTVKRRSLAIRLPARLLCFAALASLAFAVIPPAAAAQAVKRCQVPSQLDDNFQGLRAYATSCREARRVLVNRRCGNSRCSYFVSRGRAGRYRCTTRSNNQEGADFNCDGPGKRRVTFASRS